MGEDPIGILLMAYGTPRNLAEVEPYYTHIRRGRPPTSVQLAELIERYKAIGGRSPLNEITAAVADALEAELSRDHSAIYRVYVGMKHWHPYLADTVQQMASDGVRRAIAITMTPQYSPLSVGTYQESVEKALAEQEANLEVHFVRSWHNHPGLVAALTRRVRQALDKFAAPAADVPVLFTAHSLPARLVTDQDPYADQLAEMARLVSVQAGVQTWHVGYQSAGRTPDPWLGPDLGEMIVQLHDQGVRQVVVCPAGFVADHLEVLYDIDREARAQAADLGMQLERTASLNADPDFIGLLAQLVREHPARAQW